MTSDNPWRDKETLERLYWDEGLNQTEVAERLGCSRRTISTWMTQHGIETRKGHPVVPWVPLSTWHGGYELWKDKCPPSVDDNVLVHRLLAVAEYGFDALEGKHVHHKNGIPWDNRPDNIELMGPSEHMKHHHESMDVTGEQNPNAKLTAEQVLEIRAREGEKSRTEFAEEYGVSRGCIEGILSRKNWQGLEPEEATA